MPHIVVYVPLGMALLTASVLKVHHPLFHLAYLAPPSYHLLLVHVRVVDRALAQAWSRSLLAVYPQMRSAAAQVAILNLVCLDRIFFVLYVQLARGHLRALRHAHFVLPAHTL